MTTRAGTFGGVLREVRETAKKTLKAVAEGMGWSVVYVSDIERGKRNPPSESKIRELAEILGTNACRLIDLANKERKRVELDIENRSPNVEQAALVLARSWNDITEEQAEKILDVLNKEECTE